jgi:hypothetical protein
MPRQSLIEKYGHIPAQLKMNKEGWANYIEKFNLDEAPSFEDALTIAWWKNLNLDINHILPLLQQFGALQQWTATSEGLRRFGDT